MHRIVRGPISSLLGGFESVISDTKPTFTIVMRRREDLLFVRVNGYNLVRRGQHLRREFSAYGAYLVFTFEPQHLTEQAFLDPPKPGGSPKRPGSSKALLAYPSRVAFRPFRTAPAFH